MTHMPANFNTDAINIIIPELEKSFQGGAAHTTPDRVIVQEEYALWGGAEGMALALNAIFWRLQRALNGVEPVDGVEYDPEDILSRIEDKIYFAGLNRN